MNFTGAEMKNTHTTKDVNLIDKSGKCKLKSQWDSIDTH